MRERGLPRNYWDFAAIRTEITKERPETPGTPPVHIVLQVAEALRMMHEEGLERVYQRHAQMAARARRGASELGLSLQCPELGAYSTTLTAIAAPAGVSPKDLRNGMRVRGVLTAGGLGKYKDSAFRIGHMGDIRLGRRRAHADGARRDARGASGRAMKLQTKILAGLAAGVLVGIVARFPGAGALRQVVLALEPLGTVFIRLITMVVVPLVVASLFVGVASLGDVRRLGRIGGKTLAYFAGTTLVAATIGLGAALAARLGEGLDAATRDSLTTEFEQHGTAAAQAAAPTLTQTLLAMIPSNPFAAAAQGDLLPLIVAVCIFGAAATAVTSDGKRAVVSFFEGVNELSMVVIGWLMRLAPAAVFVLIAATVARSRDSTCSAVSLVYCARWWSLALALHVVIAADPRTARFGARLGADRRSSEAVSDALLLAFSTASSNATLPVSMAAARDRLGISNEVVSFVLPLGRDAQQERRGRVQGGDGGVHRAALRRRARAGTAGHDRADVDGGGVRGRRRARQLARDDADRAERHRPGPARGSGDRAGGRRSTARSTCAGATVNTIGNLVGAAWIARSEQPA